MRVSPARLILIPGLCLALAGAARAETPSSPPSSPESVPADPHGGTDGGPHGGLKPGGVVGEPLRPGANSFTEAQVRERFATIGFNEVSDLTLDEKGIWRGRASHAGKTVSVGMDFKGNVAAE